MRQLLRAQVRDPCAVALEMVNAFNRTQLGNPNTQVDKSDFGIVSGQANSPRQVHLALKLVF